MKAKRFLTLTAMFLLAMITASAQARDEVTLTVTGDGATKEEATRVALRSAIEQAYGTFVSANTQILNDELVKDEIVTVSSGNVKSYKELTCLEKQGRSVVTLQTTVCISKLVSYAQSKGASAELAGATFAMNMKIKELNKQNEAKALYNMFDQLTNLGNVFDYKLDLGEPYMGENGNYEVKATVRLLYTDRLKAFNDIAYNTISSLSLSKSELDEYDMVNIPYQIYQFPGGYENEAYSFALRNALKENVIYDDMSYASFKKYLTDILQVYALHGFYIRSNVEERSTLPMEIFEFKLNDGRATYLGNNKYNIKEFSPFIYTRDRENNRGGVNINDIDICMNVPNGAVVGEFSMHITIPQNEIAKYSNFEVVSQSVQFGNKTSTP